MEEEEELQTTATGAQEAQISEHEINRGNMSVCNNEHDISFIFSYQTQGPYWKNITCKTVQKITTVQQVPCRNG